MESATVADRDGLREQNRELLKMLKASERRAAINFTLSVISLLFTIYRVWENHVRRTNER